LKLLRPGDWVKNVFVLPGIVVDKFELRKINQALLECCKIVTPGDTEFHLDDIVPQASRAIKAMRR